MVLQHECRNSMHSIAYCSMCCRGYSRVDMLCIPSCSGLCAAVGIPEWKFHAFHCLEFCVLTRVFPGRKSPRPRATWRGGRKRRRSVRSRRRRRKPSQLQRQRQWYCALGLRVCQVVYMLFVGASMYVNVCVISVDGCHIHIVS